MRELSEDAKIAVAYSQHALATILAKDTPCIKCGNQGAMPHSCPYLSDIDGDYETKCNCCANCMDQCSDDI